MKNKTLTRKDLIARVAKTSGLTQTDANTFVNTLFQEIQRALNEGGTVPIAWLGKFTPYTKKPRLARNPRTGEPIDVPAKVTVKFKPSSTLLKKLNNK